MVSSCAVPLLHQPLKTGLAYSILSFVKLGVYCLESKDFHQVPVMYLVFIKRYTFTSHMLGPLFFSVASVCQAVKGKIVCASPVLSGWCSKGMAQSFIIQCTEYIIFKIVCLRTDILLY